MQPITISTSNIQKTLFCKGPISSSTPVCPKKRVSRIKRVSRRRQLIKQSNCSKYDPITKFVKCIGKVSSIDKVLDLFSLDTTHDCDVNISIHSKIEEIDKINETASPGKDIQDKNTFVENKIINKLSPYPPMFPSMPSLFTPVKINSQDEEEDDKGIPVKRDLSLEISEDGITSFPSCSSLNISTKTSDSSVKQDVSIQETKVEATPKVRFKFKGLYSV